jgi:hypothetical protein
MFSMNEYNMDRYLESKVEQQAKEIKEQEQEIRNLKLRLEKIETLVSNLLELSNKRSEQCANEHSNNKQFNNEQDMNIHGIGVEVGISPAFEQKENKRKSCDSIDNDVESSAASKHIARSLNDSFSSEQCQESTKRDQLSSSLSSAPVENNSLEKRQGKRNIIPKSKMLGIQVEKTFNYFGRIINHKIDDGEIVWQAEFEDGERLDLDLDDVVDAVARFDEQGGKRKTNAPNHSPQVEKVKEIIDRLQLDPTSVVGHRILKPFLVDGEVHSIIGAKFEVLFQNGLIEEMTASEIEDCICK